MTTFTAVRSVLAVKDLAASLRFYCDVLGMTLDFQAPGWASVSRGSFRVMLGECPDEVAAGDTGDHSYFAYVTVAGIDDLYREWQEKPVEFTQPLAGKPWGMREFGIRTLDGHRIMFGQSIET